MRFMEGRGVRGDGANLDGGQPQGPTVILRQPRGMLSEAPLKFPDDPAIVKIVETAMLVGRMGEGGYILKNVYGDERAVPYGATLELWHTTSQELMDIALTKALSP